MVRKLPAYLTEAEFIVLIKQKMQKHHKLAFILGFYSGLRVSEVVKLRKEDIDLAGKRIFIREAKGKKDRVVPLPFGFPASYLELFPIPCGKRALQIVFKGWVKKAGINKSGLTFHSLRHSFAVNCMEKGMPLNHVQILLGHESITTTSIYLKVNPKDALDSYNKLWNQ